MFIPPANTSAMIMPGTPPSRRPIPRNSAVISASNIVVLRAFIAGYPLTSVVQISVPQGPNAARQHVGSRQRLRGPLGSTPFLSIIRSVKSPSTPPTNIAAAPINNGMGPRPSNTNQIIMMIEMTTTPTRPATSAGSSPNLFIVRSLPLHLHHHSSAATGPPTPPAPAGGRPARAGGCGRSSDRPHHRS